MIKVGGVWKQPTQTFVKIAGVWKTVSTVKVKGSSGWKDSTFAGPPPAPVLSYTADREFTITNYSAALTYVLTGGGTRTGNKVTGAVNNATLKASYGVGLPQSAPSTMLVAAHGIVLDSVYSGPHSDAGCGPRGNYCCGGGAVMDTAGNTCGGAPGTQGDFCGGGCGGTQNCFGFFNIYCYNWHTTNYTSSGYVLFGSNWGKAVNG